jgi:hypothetical protein
MMERLLNKWVGWVCLAVLAVVAFFTWLYWPEVYTYCVTMADAYSVFGFALGFLGFAITIATLLDIRQISQRAREETRRDVRTAVERVALSLLAAETGTLLRIVSEIRTASRAGRWEEAFVLCREARLAADLSLGNPLLLDAERQGIRTGGLDLRQVLRYIETRRLGALPRDQAPPVQPLPAMHIGKLDALASALGEIQARLRQQALEVPNA